MSAICLHPGCKDEDTISCPQCAGSFCVDHMIVDEVDHSAEAHWELDPWDGYKWTSRSVEGPESLFDCYEDDIDDE
jgi:hypothetical protein